MVQAKLDITSDAPDFVCLVCGTEGKWKDATWTLKVARCPKCGEDGMLVGADEARDLDDYIAIRQGMKERINQQRKELGLPLLKMKKER